MRVVRAKIVKKVRYVYVYVQCFWISDVCWFR